MLILLLPLLLTSVPVSSSMFTFPYPIVSPSGPDDYEASAANMYQSAIPSHYQSQVPYQFTPSTPIPSSEAYEGKADNNGNVAVILSPSGQSSPLFYHQPTPLPTTGLYAGAEGDIPIYAAEETSDVILQAFNNVVGGGGGAGASYASPSTNYLPGLDKINPTPVAVGILVLTGLSLLFPNYVTLSTVRRRRRSNDGQGNLNGV